MILNKLKEPILSERVHDCSMQITQFYFWRGIFIYSSKEWPTFFTRLKGVTKRCKIFNQEKAQSNQMRINQRGSDPDADFCEPNVAQCQQLHWRLSKKDDMGELSFFLLFNYLQIIWEEASVYAVGCGLKYKHIMNNSPLNTQRNINYYDLISIRYAKQECQKSNRWF